ncbi:MAG TPA: ArsA family ATPase [Pyrinomonadaceae bacterium]|nr:ArsA family ATPase [Pyrinomonadaceae bacterium]
MAKSPGRAKKTPRVQSLPPALKLPASRYLFFGGKGGTGKTTAAASTALHLLDTSLGDERILLFSTDPAHSLSDSLGVEVGDRLVEVARQGEARLVAYEMDASAALDKFKDEHRRVLGEIADRGTLLDESDINELLNLSLPGVDEVMALFELSQLDREGDFARVVVDTAPSGHTSRLLRLPDVFSQMVAALDRMADKHRYIVAQFARGGRGRAREDEVDIFLRDLAERIERVRTMLYDSTRTSFTLVTIPEIMSVEETRRYFALLKQEGVPVTDLLVNRLDREHGACPYCRSRATSQKPLLKEIDREFSALKVHHVPLLPAEVRGPEALREFARLVWSEDKKGLKTNGRAGRATKAVSTLPPSHGAAFTVEARRVLIFGGKGGTGKTTAAAATALALAENNRSARILVFSTDPAHSLADSFGETVGELKRGVAGLRNLDAMEIDPAARFEELKTRYRAWADELFARLASGSRWEIQFDREAMRELVSLAPPGIDEIAALSAISDLLDEGRYTTIVLDTAPTGHLVRFLELPGVALSWVRTFIKLLLKYQSVVRPAGVAEELIALSRSIKRVIALITDERACEFVGVAIPERMSLEETVRLTAALKQLKVPLRRLLVNGVVAPEAAKSCDFCRARRNAQDEVLKAFSRGFKGKAELFTAPQQPHEIRGPEQLREHFARWQPLTISKAGTGQRRKGEKG